jgi:NAD(P)-dependent dehydrogenase (short-subunit alcohol dehydrogenase family)
VALEKRGASVYSVARTSGEQATEVGDAADPEVLKRLRERILKEHGHLDVLICNACPPILPLRLEESAAGRIGDYISRAIGLCLIPICVFSELLNTSQGCLVTISSAVVDQPVREWPHYTAAKQAVEALTQVAALQYPGLRTLIVRPPKLLTSMTNTPMGRMGATSPREFARHIAARLENPLDAGKTEVLK